MSTAIAKPMPTPAASLAPATPSVRTGVLWTTAGMGVYSACQWAMMSVIAKLGSAELVGEYALGLAIAVPVLMLAQMNLRAFLATDTNGEYAFSDYRNLRVAAMIASVAGIGIFSALVRGFSRESAIIVLVAAAQAIEWVSDTYQGLMQQHERMDRLAASYALRGILSVAGLGAGLWLTGDLLIAISGVIAARVVSFLVCDAGWGVAGLSVDRRTAPFQVQIAKGLSLLKASLPLGVVLVLVALTANVPRYFIAAEWNKYELGIFSALSSLVSAGSLFVNAIGQAATPRLAKLFARGQMAGFRMLVAQLIGAGAVLMAGAVGGSIFLGQFVLAIAYRPEYASRNDLLIAIMAAGSLGYIASLLGYAITAGRCFREQIPLHIAVLVATVASAAVLTRGHGVFGAAYSVAFGFAVQIAGELWILRRAMAAQDSIEAHNAA